MRALAHLTDGGIVVFDNTLRRRYRRAIAAAPLIEQRHWGLTPTLPYPDQTSILTRRFTTPLRRLTEASRALAEGDLSQRVPARELGASSIEMAELATQFNTMADRLEQSVEMIRNDRDRSRDFLADVSHELRTPIAALRTFNELMSDEEHMDDATRDEFMEQSRQQIERLDWLTPTKLLITTSMVMLIIITDGTFAEPPTLVA